MNTFQIEGNRVVVSDPCYKRGTWCQGIVENPKKGTWEGSVTKFDDGEWGTRITQLICCHEDFSPLAISPLSILPFEHWQKLPFDVGVDSGQAGVFDDEYYQNDESVKDCTRKSENVVCEDEPWYSICCDRTLGKEGFGTVPHGFVSTSGYGDGVYTAYCLKKDDEVIAVKIVFISDESKDYDK